MKKIILLISSILLTFATSIAFSALSTSLAISSEVKFRPLADIRVNSITMNEATNGGMLSYESDYSKNTVSSGFILPNSNSSISYRIHIDNSGDVDYSIYDILKTSSDSGLNVSVAGYSLTDVIQARTSLDLLVTYTTTQPSENVINVVNTLDFRKVYHIRYETGTDEIIPEQLKYEGVNLVLSNQEPTKNGYTFSKWNTKIDGTGVNYSKGATYTVDGDQTLYAKYNLNTYNINYVLNGGTNPQVNPTTYTIESNDITLANAEKTNYAFLGWTGNGTTTPTKNLVIPQGTYGDLTFTANFEDQNPPEITVTNQNQTENYLTTAKNVDAAYNDNKEDVTVYINATDVGSGIDKIEYAYATSATVPSTGWTTTQNGELTVNKQKGVYYLHVKATDKEGNETIVTTKAITVRLRVSYYDDYSKSTEISQDQYYVNTALTTRTPETVTGYAFAGWYSDQALTTKVADANTSYTPTKSIKLYGKWNATSFTITYAMNNGINNANNPNQYNTESNPITLQAPTKTLTFKGNYNATSGANASSTSGVVIGTNTTQPQTFAGWTGSNGSTAQTTVTIPTGSTGNKSYTAHWTAVAGTVPTVTRTGYTCGWSTSSTGTSIDYASGAIYPTNAITENQSVTVNLYAVCTPDTYTVTADANGGTIPSTTGWTGTGNTSTKNVVYDTPYGTLPTPTRTGYTFAGWTHGIQFEGKRANAWVYPFTEPGEVESKLNPNTTYKVEYDITINEPIPSGYTASNTGQWGGIRFRSGPSSSPVYSTATDGIYSQCGSSYTVGQKYHVIGQLTTPSDLSTTQLIFYTANTTSSGGTQYRINGTISNVVFYPTSDTYGPVTSTTVNKIAENHTIQAVWTPNTYQLTINPNGGTFNGTTSNTTISQPIGTTYSVPNNPTRPGYVFNGWTLTGGGSHTYYDTSVTPTETQTFNYNSASSTLPTPYNNSNNGAVTRSMVADSTATGGYSLRVVTNGTASPSAGGIYIINFYPTTPGRINVVEVKAKIPVGYTINLGGISPNYTGIGSAYKYSSNQGTGDWETYYLPVYFGITGTISNYGYIYLDGSNNTSVSWNINSVVMKSYTPAQFKTVYTFGSSNGTLTANWSTGGSKVQFYPNNGSFDTTYVKIWSNGYIPTTNTTVASRTYTYDTAYGTHPGETNYNWTPDQRVISRQGYTFDGWYTAATGGTQIFDKDGKLNASVSGYSDANRKWIKYDANVSLYAHWTPNQYTIKYNAACDGTSSGTMANSTYNYDANGTLRENAYTCGSTITYQYNGATGGNANQSVTAPHTFLGWTAGAPNVLRYKNLTNSTLMTINQDGTLSYNVYNETTGPKYADFFYEKINDLTPDGNYVFVADIKETSDSNNTIWVSQGNTGAQLSPSYGTANYTGVGLNYHNTITISDFTSATLSLRGVMVIGAGTSRSMKFRPVLFEGMYADTDLYYYDEGTVNNLATTGTVNFYADWAEPIVTLPTPTKTGYAFAGWYSDSSLSTKVGNGGDSYILSGNETLYAKWTPNTYTITYTMNGGPNPATKPTTGTYGSDVQISNPASKTVTITGNANGTGATVGSATTGTQTFTGWTSTTLGSNAKTGTAANPSTTWTGTSTKNTYFKNLRESGTVTMVANWSGTATLPTLSKTGYTCKWYDAATGGNEMGAGGATWTIPSNSSTSVTAYARCTINSYTLTINPSGGTYNGTTSNTTVTQNYGTTYSVPNNPTSPGYIFAGWKLTSGNGDITYFQDSEKVNQYIINSTSSAKPAVYNNKSNGTVTHTIQADSTSSTGYSMKITTNGEAQPGAGGFQNPNTAVAGAIYYHKVVAKVPVGYNLNIGSNSLGVGYGSYWLTSNAGTGDWETYIYAQYAGYNGPFSSFGHVFVTGSNNQNVTWYINESTMYRKGASLTETQASNIVFGFLNSNATLTAQWSTSGISVTWDKQGGTFGNGTIGNNWTATYTGFRYGSTYSGTKAAPYYISDNDFAIYKTGYTFDGWYTATTGGTQVFDKDGKLNASVSGYSNASRVWQKYDSNVTLYARWIPNGYTVTYNTTENGGTGTIASQTVAFGNAISLTPTATKSGWTFVGWNTDKDATTALSSLTMGIDNVTLYAIYRKEAVTLTANWNANSATLSSTTQGTCTLAAVYNKATQATSCTITPPTITRTNYSVIGWNTTASATTNSSDYNTSTNKLTVTTTTTGTTWYAITKKTTALTATFANNNGATVASTTATCYLYNGSSSCTVTAPTVTPQSGFTHIGFNTSTSSTSNNSNYNTSTNALTISANGTWYPITRSSTQYTGTFTVQDTNAATKSGGTTSCYRYNGATTCNITAPTLTAKSGYTVVGWDKTSTSTTAAYPSAGTITIDANTTFYSITYANTSVTITFNRNVTNSKAQSLTPYGGTASTGTSVTATCRKMNGSSTCTIKSPTMTVVTGYHAVGFATSANATTSSWNVNTDKAVSADTTYYAITAGNSYSIRFNANCPTGTTASGSMSDLGMVYGQTKALTQNAFSCSNRVFTGWTTNAAGTGDLYDDKEQVSNLTAEDGAIVNLYGRWRLQAPSPTISGGTTRIYGSGATTLTCNETTSYSTGTTKYYSFGYATSSNGTPNNWTTASTTNTLSIAANEYVGDRYYACRVYVRDSTEESDTVVSPSKTQMKINNAKLTFSAGTCGTISGTSPAYVNKGMTGVYTGITNTTVGTIPYTTKSGYTFTGWYDGSTKVINGDKTIVASVSNWTASDKKWLITADKSLTAQCTRDEYTITYALNNGTVSTSNPASYNVESSTFTLNNPTKTLTFKGNYNATSGANASSTSGVSIGSNTTKAQTFAGWSGTGLSSNATSVTVSIGSTGNRTYIAHWTAVAGTLPTVSRTGYTCGWSTSSSGTSITYASGATFPTSAISESSSATINLYAVCTPNTYTITLNNQSATTAGTTTIYEKYNTGYYKNSDGTTQITTSSNAITIPAKDHNTFGGYYTATNGGGTQIIASTGKLASGASTTQFSANGTLYAKWSPKTFTVKYACGSGASGSGPSNQTATYNATFTTASGQGGCTKTGYSFAGWKDPTGVSWTGWSGTWTYDNGEYGISGDSLTLTAQWTANNYYIDLNGTISGIRKDNITGCGTADIYVNGTQVANDVSDFKQSYVTGSSYTIKDIKASTGCTYTGSSTISGTIGGSDVDARLTYTFSGRTYSYTGGIQTFYVPVTATYKLEVWGAQGGAGYGYSSGNGWGGNGGYSYGNKYLTAGTTIYVVVGGRGAMPGYTGGYNGGGNGGQRCGPNGFGGGGGGATHIGSQNAVLKNCTSSNVYIVAGGGGGSSEYSSDRSAVREGGNGGGSSGGNGVGGSYIGKGGTQSAAGASGDTDCTAAGFGYGGSSPYGNASNTNTYCPGGGGGGWYGGGASSHSSGGGYSTASGGGGGSGYIGGVSSGSTTAGSRVGNGEAKITIVG